VVDGKVEIVLEHSFLDSSSILINYVLPFLLDVDEDWDDE